MLARLRTTSPRTLLRFALTGAVVAMVHIGIMTTLVGVLDAPVQPSLLLAYVGAVSLHFTLNRNLVFATDAGFALHLSAQGARYLGLTLFSYTTTALSLAVLPGLLDLPVLLVYLVTISCVTVVTFTVLQGFIFHPPDPVDASKGIETDGNEYARAQERADGSSSRSSLSSKP